MPIEVSSIPERRWRKGSTDLSPKGIVVRAALLLAAIVTIVCADTLLTSYQYHSRLIDARLAAGYLTSRPGLYAAPRSLRAGMGYSPQQLTEVLRRAGYVENGASNVWSGNFTKTDSAIEICRTSAKGATIPECVRVSFTDRGIDEITADGLTQESFTLEPEVITNDLAAKTAQPKRLTYAELPEVLVQAVLAIEDTRYFDHSGIDIIGLARAVSRNLGEERAGQGGSTITQQLVKNTYLTPERTYRRKFAEAMLAVALERRLSKQEIFALYCNEVYLGQRGALGARGVEQAARLYFGKELKALTLAEAATIAGMIQGPSRYSPDKHPDAARNRRNTVLGAMLRDQRITSDQANAASAEPLVIVPLDKQRQSLAPYFVDYATRVAESELNASAESNQIYTTIDLELQALAENALQHQLSKLDKVYKDQKPQAALVALDPRSGHVLAMVGGRDYADSQLNRVTDSRRQPGSTFKPIVYAAALEDGRSPLQIFTDAPREFVYDHKRTYRPSNYGGAYSMGEVTMRTGLVKSLNVVTVDLAMQTGLARIATLAEKFGLPRPDRYPSLALGVEEVTPLELAAAYASFVNGGRRIQPRVVASVSEPPPAHARVEEPKQIIQPTTAYVITSMLADVIRTGTARSARKDLKGIAVAGKTGTSRDGWFVGYSPNLVCVVWIGFDDNSQLGLSGASSALPAWTEFMTGALKLRPELGGDSFECPEGIKFVEVDAENGLLSTLSCPHRELVAVAEQVQPNVECFKHPHLIQESGDRSQETGVELERPTDVVTESRNQETGVRRQEREFQRSTHVDTDARGRRTLVSGW